MYFLISPHLLYVDDALLLRFEIASSFHPLITLRWTFRNQPLIKPAGADQSPAQKLRLLGPDYRLGSISGRTVGCPSSRPKIEMQ